MTRAAGKRRGRTFRLPTIRAAVEFRREEMGWSKLEMARQLGWYVSHYCEFTKGRRGLPHKIMCMAHDLGVPANVLLQTPNSKRAYEQRQRLILAGAIKEPA